jgi:hypothetical protein
MDKPNGNDQERSGKGIKAGTQGQEEGRGQKRQVAVSEAPRS